CRELADVLARATGVPLGRERVRSGLKKAIRYDRPPGRLAPAPAARAYASVDLAARAYQARRGEILVLYADATVLWRFALPRASWWRTAQRACLPIRSLRPSQSKREAARKRQAGGPSRSWSRAPAACGSASLGPSNMAPPRSSIRSS